MQSDSSRLLLHHCVAAEHSYLSTYVYSGSGRPHNGHTAASCRALAACLMPRTWMPDAPLTTATFLATSTIFCIFFLPQCLPSDAR